MVTGFSQCCSESKVYAKDTSPWTMTCKKCVTPIKTVEVSQ